MAGENSRVPNRGNQNTNFKSIQSNLYITICRDIYEIFRKYRYIKIHRKSSDGLRPLQIKYCSTGLNITNVFSRKTTALTKEE
ncbi:unnamed protein product [Rhizophagus irregularis]|uniref:Uncharacterized protein n=1 Tax=Rhizophagus irregularis TaxID=588596 RepID=A0A916EKJ3_9GLOM|nr:unnamed protein product [Rhizophagus irregularis]